MIELLNHLNPDMIALQESMMPHADGVFAPFKSGKEISDYFVHRMPYSFFAPLFMARCRTKNGICIRDCGGQVEQGTQLLSNQLILAAENEFYYNNYKTEYDATRFREKDWARSILVVVIELSNGKQVKIINVHGIWNASRMGDDRTVSRSEFIISEVLKDKIPTIVVGDFNLLPSSPSIKIIE